MIIYNFIKFLYLSIKYNHILTKVYENEHILEGLSKMLGVELKRDWIGRIYTVLNPYIVDGKFDPTTVVAELGSDVPSEIMVEKFIMDRFNIASKFIRANNLFDLLTYKIEKQDVYDNYLFIMEPLPYEDLFKWSKWFAGLLAVLLIVGIILLIVL